MNATTPTPVADARAASWSARVPSLGRLLARIACPPFLRNSSKGAAGREAVEGEAALAFRAVARGVLPGGAVRARDVRLDALLDGVEVATSLGALEGDERRLDRDLVDDDHGVGDRGRLDGEAHFA